MTLNDPTTLAEATAAFQRYEHALVNNVVEVLDELFWDSPHTIRLGATENLYGIAAIREFRRQRPSKGLARELHNTVITTYGTDMAVASTEYRREGVARVGRQSQTWMRTPAGWRVVHAHVSWMD